MVSSMRPLAATLTVAAGATMLVGGWRAGAQPVTVDFAVAAPADAVDTASAPSPAAAAPSASLAAPVPAPVPEPQLTSGTFVGPRVDTRYGVMQVQVVLDHGAISAVQPLMVGGGDGESVRINNRAVPQLQERVLAAQTWNVNYVSGASYTSQGILASAKGALAGAGL